MLLGVCCFRLLPSARQVHDQEVIYKNVSIEGPNGTIRSGNKPSEDNDETRESGVYTYKGCFRDTREDRVFASRSNGDDMTTEV